MFILLTGCLTYHILALQTRENTLFYASHRCICVPQESYDRDRPCKHGPICNTIPLCLWCTLTSQSPQQVVYTDVFFRDYMAICFHLVVIYSHYSNHRRGGHASGGIHTTSGGTTVCTTVFPSLKKQVSSPICKKQYFLTYFLLYLDMLEGFDILPLMFINYFGY